MAEEEKVKQNGKSQGISDSASSPNAPAKSTAQKLSAADRIRVRLQKKTQEIPAVQATSQKSQDESSLKTDVAASPEKAQMKKKEEAEEFYEVALSEEWAKVWEALQLKVISEDDVILGLFDKTRGEKEGKNTPLLELIQERRVIPAAHRETIQKVSEEKIKIKGKPPKPAAMDIILSQIIMEYKVIEREEIQRILRVQANLYKLGIRQTLQSLLIASKLVAKDTINSLVEQCQKKIGEQKGQEIEQRSVSAKALVSPPRKQYAVVRFSLHIFLAFLVLFAILFIAIFSMKPKPFIEVAKRNEPEKSVLPPSHPSSKPPHETKPESPKPVSEQEPEIVNREETIEKHRKARGLEKWGKYWITKAQNEDLSKTWKPGTKPENLSFNFAADVSYMVRQGQAGIIIDGRLDIPPLSRGLQLKMYMELLHGLKSKEVYVAKTFDLDPNNSFKVIVAPLPKPLAVGTYWLAFTLAPDAQNEFLRDFLQISTPKEWFVCFSVGTDEEIKNYYGLQVSRIESIMADLQKQYEKLSGVTKKINQEKWHVMQRDIEAKLRELQARIEENRGKMMIPLFPTVENNLSDLLRSLDTMLHSLREWHTNATSDSLNLLDPQIKFAQILHSARITLKNQSQGLLDILKTEKKIVATEK